MMISRCSTAAAYAPRHDAPHTDPGPGCGGDRNREIDALVRRALAPNRVRLACPGMEHLAHRLLDELAERGQGDLMAEYAEPFVIRTIARVLGLPDDDADRIRRFTEDASVLLGPQEDRDGEGPGAPDQLLRFGRVAGFLDHLTERIAEKRRAPDGGIVSVLVHADGARPSDPEIRRAVVELLLSGRSAARIVGGAIHRSTAGPASADAVAAGRSPVPELRDGTGDRSGVGVGRHLVDALVPLLVPIVVDALLDRLAHLRAGGPRRPAAAPQSRAPRALTAHWTLPDEHRPRTTGLPALVS
ncbi:hypothetical protein WIS52_29690 [Pseudonocardia nematodicida]|uniref:Cytochrome P450 n=1 Tax=Pseudonocardia nematodicida TaxID=1206997 RepID=A0ABV1KM49_9PSEU